MDNNWAEMRVAEWRGAVGKALENIEETLDELCTTVRKHETDLAVLLNDRKRHQTAGVSRRKFWTAIIAALLAGPITALILRVI